MSERKERIFSLDGDELTIELIYNAEHGIFIGDYPDFSETPRLTPNGRPWTNATFDDCPFADTDYGDCGSCNHFKTEMDGDLIGICTNKKLKKRGINDEI